MRTFAKTIIVLFAAVAITACVIVIFELLKLAFGPLFALLCYAAIAVALAWMFVKLDEG